MIRSQQCQPEGVRSGKAAQVLDAAKRLFIDRGFGATSMDAIAARAGVSKATVYAHYPSKEALFAATARRECERVMVRMAIPEDVDNLPLKTALERIAGSFLKAGFGDENIALLRMVIAEAARLPELGEIFYECAPGLALAGVVGYMRQARDHGLIKTDDCELAATQFLGMLRGDLHLRRLLGLAVDSGALDRVAQGAVRAFLSHYAV